MKRRILEAMASYEREMVEFSSELVRIPTENPPGHFYLDCVEAIGRKLQQIGLDYRIHEIKPPEQTAAPLPRYWLESEYGDRGPRLYFHGHYDVVPASEEGQFEPRQVGGKLYGRGAADMKSGLAAMVYAVRALKECRSLLAGRIALVIVPDEETGGRLGTRYLAESGQLGGDAVGMLTAEPTSGVVWNASRGAISLRVRVRGRSVHVGLQYQGVNAFEKMIEIGEELLKLKAEVESRNTRFNIEPELARRSILMLGGRVEGGDNFNVVPQEVSFTVDRRINPEEDLAEEKGRLLALFDGFRKKGVKLEVELLQEGVSAGVPEDSELGLALARSIEDVTGKGPRFELCPGLLETRFYVARGVPALAYGPGVLSASHGPEECVSLSDITASAAVYALTASRMLSPA